MVCGRRLQPSEELVPEAVKRSLVSAVHWKVLIDWLANTTPGYGQETPLHRNFR